MEKRGVRVADTLSAMTMFSPTGGEAQAMQAPQRTSVAAILSLVAGILGLVVCCVPFVGPVFAVLGLLCAVFAFLAIGRSEGRLGGRGLAVGGLACSLVAMLLGIVVVVGMAQISSMFGKYGDAITHVQADDMTALNEVLATTAGQKVTPEGIAAFKDESIGSLGKFKRVKPGMWAWFESFGMLGGVATGIPPQYQGGGQTLIPLQGEFDKGNGLILVLINQTEQSPTAPIGKIENIGVAPTGGPITWLIDPSGP